MHHSRKAVALTLGLLTLLTLGGPAQAGSGGMVGVDELIELESPQKPQVQLSKPVNAIQTPLSGIVSQSYSVSNEDNQNLGLLWGSVIDRNPAIQFGLKQLNTPPELRYKHTSFLTRSISALLSGAAMVPYALGADQMTAGASVVGANLANRAMTQLNGGDVDVSQLPSDTELVELSSLVHDLQEELVRHYFLYKSTLHDLVQLDEQLGFLGGKYHEAMQSEDPLDDLWLGQMYHDAKLRHLQAKNAAKHHYYVLERISGTEAMKKVHFDLALTLEENAKEEQPAPSPDAAQPAETTPATQEEGPSNAS